MGGGAKIISETIVKTSTDCELDAMPVEGNALVGAKYQEFENSRGSNNYKVMGLDGYC